MTRFDEAIVGAGSVGVALAYYRVRDHGVQRIALVERHDPMGLTSAQSGENYRNWWPHQVMTAFTDHSITLLGDFIADAKANPGKLTFGSARNGSSNHLAGELLAGQVGAPLLHAPYKGSGPVLVDLLGGQLSFMFDTINTSQQHIRAGKLRALGVGTTRRSTLMPEVAPIADTLPGFEAATWVRLLAPAGTPKEIVARMQAEIAKVVRSPEVREKLSASGAEPVANPPEEFGAYVAAEVAKSGRVVKQARIPPVQ